MLFASVLDDSSYFGGKEMATKKELIDMLEEYDDDAVVICKDASGGWDNIKDVKQDGSSIAIIFGGGSPFSDE